MDACFLIAAAAFKLFWVDGYSAERFLPDSDPVGGVLTNELGMAAAQGEIESMSFVLNPELDIPRATFKVSDLVGPGRTKIPSSAVDFALVKVWFRAEGRWQHYYAGNRSKPTPINELILHDDSLVKVDWTEKKNYLRVDYPSGSRYFDMSSKDCKEPFNCSLQPVRDAARFVPIDLRKGFRQQFWVTVSVPKDAKPGVYKGTIGTIPFKVEVYPFSLPQPKTHYDTSKPYYSYWIGVPHLQRLLDKCGDLAKSERQLRAICRSLKEHNAVNVSSVGNFTDGTTDDLAVRTLLIARNEGLCSRPLVNERAWDDASFIWFMPGGKPPRKPEDAPEEYQKALDTIRRRVVFQHQVCDRYLGHHDCYYQNLDEIGPVVSRNSFGYWSLIRGLGGKIWADGLHHYDLAYGVDMHAMAGGEHSAARHWHAAGSTATSYACLFTGAACPDIWRRTKCFRCWYNDHDGLFQYTFDDGTANRWNDFIDSAGGWCQMGIVYLTSEGCISTLAWEGIREGYDDIRYFTLLRRRAEAAMVSKDSDVVKLGREAIHWQDQINPEHVVDLNAHRRQTADWIKRLIAAVGPEPEEQDHEKPPMALPPSKEGSDMPDDVQGLWKYIDGKRAKFAECRRLDIVQKALIKIVKTKTAPSADRVKAAIQLVDSLVWQLRYEDAIKVLDQILARDDLSPAERKQVLSRKEKVLHPTRVYVPNVADVK